MDAQRTVVSYGLDNLPYGSIGENAIRPRTAVVRFGDHVFDLATLDAELFADGTLDRFLAAGHDVWAQVRAAATAAIAADRTPLIPLDESTVAVGAFTVADYVDFYASEHHATNAGRIFRPNGDPLTRNWKHVPIGYHGRSGSLLFMNNAVARPWGVLGPNEFGPSQRLDFEAELAFVVGVQGSATRIDVDEADEHAFGVSLLNDWSARDIQAFETVPLGPFLGKSFATSISPWITPLAALDHVRLPAAQDPLPLPHLRDGGRHGLDLELEVAINGHVVSRPRFADMYWTYAQMLAHLTSNGARVRAGDVFASGTVSGPEREQRGCLLELTWNGTEPLDIGGGETRAWLRDGDEVRVSAAAGDITLGEVTGRVLDPAAFARRHAPRMKPA